MAFRDSINDLMFRFYERFKQNNNRLPVSVDADINVGDVQIGTVKQGAKDAEAEPWDVNIVNESPLEVQLKGSVMELYVTAWSDLPPADSVPLGTAAQLVGTTQVRQSNGTRWVVLV